jgi:hypothetical protein
MNHILFRPEQRLNNVPDAQIGVETRQRILDVARDQLRARFGRHYLTGGWAGTIALLARHSMHQLVGDRFLLQVLLEFQRLFMPAASTW